MNIQPFVDDAKKIQKQTGIPASIILGQIILESSGKYPGGLSGLAYQAKNLFGIKGTGPAGSYYVPTHEYIHGRNTTVMAGFKKYNSYYESMMDYAKLLTSPHYAQYFQNAHSVEDFARGLKQAGYATDPNYDKKLLSIIAQYNLHQYDDPNIKFNPNGLTDTSADTSKLNFIESLSFGIIRVVLMILFSILAVVFFLKAFPAANNMVERMIP
jgi:flagellum-specific peptidoglycan hydrolase FlgJ